MGPPKLPWVVGASRPLFGVSSSAALPRVSRARRRRLGVSPNTLRLSRRSPPPLSLEALKLSLLLSSSPLCGDGPLSRARRFGHQTRLIRTKPLTFPVTRTRGDRKAKSTRNQRSIFRPLGPHLSMNSIREKGLGGFDDVGGERKITRRSLSCCFALCESAAKSLIRGGREDGMGIRARGSACDERH